MVIKKILIHHKLITTNSITFKVKLYTANSNIWLIGKAILEVRAGKEKWMEYK